MALLPFEKKSNDFVNREIAFHHFLFEVFIQEKSSIN